MWTTQIQVADNLDFSEVQVVVEELIDEGLTDIAGLWTTYLNENIFEWTSEEQMVLLDLEKMLEEAQQDAEAVKAFKEFCKKQETTLENKNFQSPLCKLDQEKQNPITQVKMTELSKDPIVALYHDFLSTNEVDELLKEATDNNFRISPVIGGEDTDNSYDERRIATSYYINEEKDKLGNLTKKIKKRFETTDLIRLL